MSCSVACSLTMFSRISCSLVMSRVICYMKNLYDGVVRLDGNGEAAVELPQWFDALNQEFRYQLTAIGPDCAALAELLRPCIG
jgi:hypothetical protein